MYNREIYCILYRGDSRNLDIQLERVAELDCTVVFWGYVRGTPVLEMFIQFRSCVGVPLGSGLGQYACPTDYGALCASKS